MKLMSLFDGSGGFPLSASMCGITPIYASEVEPYPIAVTSSRFPKMKHIGDVSKVNGAELEPVDIITFGSPCQDLSVAGKRAGLKHEDNGDEETTRSGLFMEAIRIIKEMRKATNGTHPTFALWENVPGAFSSNKGEDFRIVLEEFIKINEPTATMPAPDKNGWPYADCIMGDGWSIAYRTLDAQYWGVPQRRRRIYLVADFRGERAAKILFKRESLRRYTAQSGTQGQGTATDAERGTGAADRERATPYTLKIRCGCEGGGKGALIQKDKSATLATNNDQYLFQPVAEPVGFDGYNATTTGDKAATLGVNCGMSSGRNGVVEPIAVATQQGGAEITENGVCPTITAAAGESGNNKPMVAYATVVYDARGNGDGETVPTLTGDHENRITDYTAVAVEPISEKGGNNTPAVCYCLQGNGIDRADTAGCNGKGWREDASYTLNTIDRPAVVYAVDQGGGKSACNVSENKTATLTCTHGGEPAVVYGVETFHCNVEDNKSPILKARDYKDPHVVCYDLDNASLNQGEIVEKSPTRYIVRRLTPTECARLQGFPDKWGHPDKKETLTDDEYKFWHEVRNTHAAINGKQVKQYTKEQMLTWYNKLHTDSSEYKMWGNGIALPNALYVMQGIAEELHQQITPEEKPLIKQSQQTPGEPQMNKLDTIQKKENLNEVYRMGTAGPGGAHHEYLITQKDRGPVLQVVSFQKGPRNDVNSRHGVLDCDLLEIVRDRLKAFQNGDMPDSNTQKALLCIESALTFMNRRVEDRIERGVLGTMNK